MCTSTPDVPTVPERQAAKLPSGDTGERAGDRERRRRGYAATMFADASAPAATTNILGA